MNSGASAGLALPLLSRSNIEEATPDKMEEATRDKFKHATRNSWVETLPEEEKSNAKNASLFCEI
jgi:hypothetical protein